MDRKNVLQYLSRIMSVVLMLSLIACGDDDDDDNNDDDDNDDDMAMVDELVNTYEFSSASFTSEGVIVINNPTDPTQVITFSFADGDDGTSFLEDAINGAAPCAEGVDVGIDLRTDGTSFYVCNGTADESQQGVWEVNADRTTFTLTITTLDPDFDVIMNDFSLTNGVLSGTATIPLPWDAQLDLTTGEQLTATGDPLEEASVDLLEAGGVTLTVGTPNIRTLEMLIQFTVVDF